MGSIPGLQPAGLSSERCDTWGRIRTLPPERGLQAASSIERKEAEGWPLDLRTLKRRKRCALFFCS